MPGVDMNEMRRGYEEQQRGGGDYLSLEPGETLLYIHPPCRENDRHKPTSGKNYIPVTVHYNVGKSNRMVVSLDPEMNPIIEHPFVKALLKKKKVRLTGKCPVGKALASGKYFDDEEADESRPQTKYLWGVTPMGARRKSSSAWQEHERQGEPCVALVGKQIFDGIMEAFFDNDGDISNPSGAILVRVIKSKGGRQTKYVVKSDSDTQKKPFKMSKEQRRALLKAMQEGGDCDLFRVVANMIKGPDEVSAIMKGVEVAEDEEEHDTDVDDDEELLDDDEELADEDEEENDGDDEDEGLSDSDDDDDDDDDGEFVDEDEEENEEAEEEESEEDDSDSEDEGDEEDSDLDDLDQDLADLEDNGGNEEDDPESEPPKSKKRGRPKGSKNKKDNDDGEEEPPKPKKRGRPKGSGKQGSATRKVKSGRKNPPKTTKKRKK